MVYLFGFLKNTTHKDKQKRRRVASEKDTSLNDEHQRVHLAFYVGCLGPDES